MAANYWESTQRRYWQFTKSELAERRQKLEDEDQNAVQAYPLPQLRHLSIYFNQRMGTAHSLLDGTPLTYWPS
jgi:cyclin C